MKKKLFLISVISILSTSIIACDICGAGAGGGYMGILPGFRSKFISLRYTQNSLLSHLGYNGSSTYLTTKETFRVAELWGAANIGKKFRVAAFVPYNFLERSNESGNFSQSGLGDITAIGYYQLFAKEKTMSDKLLMQSLWVGGGVKLPTGKYDPEEKNIQDASQNTFQLGTGSLDFSLHAMYDIRLQDAGINVNASYRFNQPNKYDYKYGDKFTTNVLVYYKLKLGKSVSIAPNTGVLLETAKKDQRTPELQVWETGGHSLVGTLGFELTMGRFGLGTNYQTPFSQELGEGKLKAKDRGMAYVSFSF